MNSSDITKKDNEEINKNKSIIENIKSNYILKIIFNYLPQYRLLKINKYYRMNQKRLDLNINEYKNYCESFSSIILEIIPFQHDYGSFINIDKNDELYYHIYFNNNKEEIKRTYINKNEEINNILIKISFPIISFYKLFYDCKCIKSIIFKEFYRNNINNMSKMFSNSSLKTIDFYNSNTINVIEMNEMFDSCKNLKEINISNFNTEKVRNMSCMFYDCNSLEKINISNFVTNNVIDMRCMFYGCSSLKELNISNFVTNNVIDMRGMFSGCSSLTELNLNNFNTNNVTNMSYMFSECSSLEKLNISNFNTNNVANMSYMFYKCISLKELDSSKFKIINEIDMNNMFDGCSDELKRQIIFEN